MVFRISYIFSIYRNARWKVTVYQFTCDGDNILIHHDFASTNTAPTPIRLPPTTTSACKRYLCKICLSVFSLSPVSATASFKNCPNKRSQLSLSSFPTTMTFNDPCKINKQNGPKFYRSQPTKMASFLSLLRWTSALRFYWLDEPCSDRYIHSHRLTAFKSIKAVNLQLYLKFLATILRMKSRLICRTF